MRSTPRSGDTARGVVVVGALTALACALALAETTFVPQLPVPGVRLGLANMAVLLAFVGGGTRAALRVSVGRVLIVGLVTGGLGGPAFVLAAAGAVAAVVAMSLVRSGGPAFSLVGWSAAGSFAHVGAQLVVASLLTGSPSVLLLAPLSLSISLVCGSAIGATAHLLCSRGPLTAWTSAGAGAGGAGGAEDGRSVERTA